jgi:NADPH-dependent 2,4-dienoyl-CoA reductase/sulfur reductase-like enzyme
VDAVVAAAGLRPETALARHAGLQIHRGVVVNSQLQTSHPAIYALGDCAEINGMVLPFLQPILLSAMCLSKNLLAQQGELKLPPMLVKVKTPDLPLHLAGDTRREDLTWNIVAAKDGWSRKALTPRTSCALLWSARIDERSLCAAQAAGEFDGFPGSRRKRLSRATDCHSCSPAKRSASRENAQPTAPDYRSRASGS